MYTHNPNLRNRIHMYSFPGGMMNIRLLPLLAFVVCWKASQSMGELTVEDQRLLSAEDRCTSIIVGAKVNCVGGICDPR